jgi:hypothetical protein
MNGASGLRRVRSLALPLTMANSLGEISGHLACELSNHISKICFRFGTMLLYCALDLHQILGSM